MAIKIDIIPKYKDILKGFTENDNIIKPGTTVIICNPSIITKEYRMQK